MNSEIAQLNSSLKEYEKFKLDLEPQLDTARREIELNKSMLDMLNNEINHLNTEKLQLEKKLISTRRNTTPSVIVEEDEEDLEEEERDSDEKESSNELVEASSDHQQQAGETTDGSLHMYNKVLDI